MKLRPRRSRERVFQFESWLGWRGRKSERETARRQAIACWVYLGQQDRRANAGDRHRACSQNRTLRGLVWRKEQLLDFQNPALPSLEFKVPSDFLLSPGTKVPLDKNLVAEIGELAAGIHRAFRSRFR